jgi:hypothetical protein
MNTEDLDTRSLAVGHLPLVRACLEQLGILDVLDDHLPRHTLAKASDAECVYPLRGCKRTPAQPPNG